ncbi:MAG: hypothetical protein H7X93_11960 [Sphingomonadaceae bacterium]|nr:hypothetical protein [Sphingomonadaceae bacterium]
MTRIAVKIVALVLAATAFAAPVAAQAPTALFASDDVIQLTVRGPIGAVARGGERSTAVHPATLTLEGAAPETHAIALSPRGITRRRRDICTFPPLRIEFTQPPPAASLFAGQRRLKLVTHCRPTDSFQQHVLLEFAAYRLLNALTPLSLRVRLARIDYVEEGATRPTASRLGFLIEDIDDAASRNGLVELEGGDFPYARLSPRDAARFAVFEYMIGNLDWAMQAGPAGDDCCHNSKPLAAAPDVTSGLIPIPYDFDHSGLVDAPYATPPAQLTVSSIRTRVYRGFCMHNEEARAVAAEFLAARPRIETALGAVPELSDRHRTRALAYLAGFFESVATPADVDRNLLRSCVR